MTTLPALEHHPHARAVLEPALAPGATPSHAYLFHGPAGTGKRTVARAVAAALLGEHERVSRGSHPDLTWVTPSGAHELLVSDVDEAVVAAATRRRLFRRSAPSISLPRVAFRAAGSCAKVSSFAFAYSPGSGKLA